MKDYYAILRVTKYASELDIRKSFKQLALQYHPDKNQHDPQAEEIFKEINEAYQVLSNPVKKSKYDFSISYMHRAKSYTQNWSATPPYGNQKEKSIYNRYGKFNWKNVPRYKKWQPYRIDKEYYKIQKITLGIFAAMILLAIGINVGRDYIAEIRKEFRRQENMLTLDSAHREFDRKNYDLSLEKMGRLVRNNTSDYHFYEERDSLMNELHKIAFHSYSHKDFRLASSLYSILYKYEWPQNINTLKFLSESYLKAGNTSMGIGMLEEILQRDPENIELLMQISKLYFEDLNMPEKAIEYLTQAKTVFRKIQVSIYGRAFEMAMVPSKSPEIYYRLFFTRGQVNMALYDYEEAYKDLNWALFFRPDSGIAHKMRAECGINSNYPYKVCSDLSLAKYYKVPVDDTLLSKYCYK
ncbi:MAG: DnaJ domain-containing protein [Cyclobacteriaceae bacterium]|nr:DnaJ domain-containing protein [Cyclobacteriaceae bacterium]